MKVQVTFYFETRNENPSNPPSIRKALNDWAVK